MPEHPHLARAPITEAVLDIQVTLDPGTSLDDLAALRSDVLAEFCDAEPMSKQELRITGPLLQVETNSTSVGMIYWNESRDRAVQARLNGFTFNIVRTYERWDVHREQAQRLWKLYALRARPTKVNRCALRYINRIAIPVGVDIGEVLQLYPNVPRAISSSFSEYVMRVVVPLDNERQGVITEVLPAAPGSNDLLLDVDVFSVREIAPESHALWDEFEILRQLKNRCFFESLHAQALEAYK